MLSLWDDLLMIWRNGNVVGQENMMPDFHNSSDLYYNHPLNIISSFSTFIIVRISDTQSLNRLMSEFGDLYITPINTFFSLLHTCLSISIKTDSIIPSGNTIPRHVCRWFSINSYPYIWKRYICLKARFCGFSHHNALPNTMLHCWDFFKKYKLLAPNGHGAVLCRWHIHQRLGYNYHGVIWGQGHD